ncbi:hypothetical protein HID58_090731 [Brassica napus]|uniref:Uncharacterized protein n=1 Tax=Brassica napus TaxID=3708 RepID=A0ABQ7XDI9_BRANA|nr:hypothetical protein HID58_090731 [Brassica napus]
MADDKVRDEAMQIIGMFQILPDLSFSTSIILSGLSTGIMSGLKEKGIQMAIASRSPTSDIANTFIDKLNIKSLFVAKEIFSSWSHKTEHFQKIHTRTGVSKMGVTSILVGDGVTLGALRQGLTEFSQNHNTIEKNKKVWRNKYSGKAASSETEKD